MVECGGREKGGGVKKYLRISRWSVEGVSEEVFEECGGRERGVQDVKEFKVECGGRGGVKKYLRSSKLKIPI